MEIGVLSSSEDARKKSLQTTQRRARTFSNREVTRYVAAQQLSAGCLCTGQRAVNPKLQWTMAELTKGTIWGRPSFNERIKRLKTAMLKINTYLFWTFPNTAFSNLIALARADLATQALRRSAVALTRAWSNTGCLLFPSDFCGGVMHLRNVQ